MLRECVIIGGGPAGTAAAHAALDAGLKSVLIVEREAFGGTCTNRGCIPTKFLLARSGAPGRAANPAELRGDWHRTLQHKDALVGGLSRSIESRLRERGIEVARGRARFRSAHELEITTQDGATTTCGAERFIVATGSRPAGLKGAPFNGTTVISSDEALQLTALPEAMAVVGSGAVGAEFSFLFSRLGVKVTLIEGAARLFPSEDPEVAVLFGKIYSRLGVEVRTGDPVAAIEDRRAGSAAAVQLASGAVLEVGQVLVAVGRSLESRGVDCGAAGVALGTRGDVLVDDRLRTSQSHILAAGDVTGRMLLAHAATYMGELAGRQAAGQPFPDVPYDAIPWATFTSPEVAGVGYSAERAAGAGIDAVAVSVPLMENVKARIDRVAEGFVKIVAERSSRRVIGATIVGAHASELIHVLSIAVQKGMTTSELGSVVFAHPTMAESIYDALAGINRSDINRK